MTLTFTAEESAIRTAFGRLEKHGLEFGRLCFEYGQKYGAQGSAGNGLAPVLRRLGINEGVAYYWIAKYKTSLTQSNLSSGVYFIQDTGSGLVKIGWARNVNARLNRLQLGNPDELKLLRTVNGGKKEEAEFHRRFTHLRSRGEWFRPEQELVSFIGGVQ